MRFDTLTRYPQLLLLGIGLTTASSGCDKGPDTRKVLLTGLDSIRLYRQCRRGGARHQLTRTRIGDRDRGG